MLAYLTELMEPLMSVRLVSFLEKISGIVAIFALFIHLVLLFLAKNNLISAPELANSSYITVISTPFTVILAFEVLILIMSISRPIAETLLKQYQVISLVFIREVFKLFSIYSTNPSDPVLLEMLARLLASLAIFALLLVFSKQVNIYLNKGIRRGILITFAKGITMIIILIITFGILWGYLFGEILPNLFLYLSGGFRLSNFIAEVFTLMVVGDVVLLLVSLASDDGYSKVIRNSFFVISAALIRLSFTLPTPQAEITAVLAVVIGIISFAIYFKFNAKKFTKTDVP